PSWFALIVDPDLALGVLQTLARFQGDAVDPITEEEPGRILHEMRFGDAPSLSLGGGQVYYGTADATPLFVMLLGELRRWGLAREAVDSLLPAADRAMEWIEHFGDRDGDGYVEYQRTRDRGWYAMALDGDKAPVDALTSNIGHCLWTGIVDEDKAPLVAARLLSSEMFSGWGVRTLATSMAGYNPISYHNGSIWPHDNAIV